MVKQNLFGLLITGFFFHQPYLGQSFMVIKFPRGDFLFQQFGLLVWQFGLAALVVQFVLLEKYLEDLWKYLFLLVYRHLCQEKFGDCGY